MRGTAVVAGVRIGAVVVDPAATRAPGPAPEELAVERVEGLRVELADPQVTEYR
ncbi:hypothetical protein [Pseudonocardia pini]|uniref:hypothetical protein n=1 Tax=Pseudonocardia pini TaxID=2758030 RepID=UPI001FEBF560|nr:hypothetical protein [Pseudonocardia pini]